MRKLLGLVLLLCLSPLRAASFDCAKASTRMEKLICSDALLSKTDEVLNQTYQDALRRTHNKKTVKLWQREWLNSWEVKHCDTSDCLLKPYLEQIMLLRDIATKGRESADWTGSYHQLLEGRKTSQSASLLLVGLRGNRVFISAFAVQGPTAHTGVIKGVGHIKEGRLLFDFDGCAGEMRLDSQGPVMEKEEGCGGVNVSFLGQYRAD